MRTIQLSAALVSVAMMLGAARCRNAEAIRKSCEGVMCTRMFAAVTVQVQDASGAAVALDSTRVSNAELGIRVTGGPVPDGGGYTIVDDSRVAQLAQHTATVTFTGYKGGREVVRQDYVVGADCCHVSKVNGPEVLSVK